MIKIAVAHIKSKLCASSLYHALDEQSPNGLFEYDTGSKAFICSKAALALQIKDGVYELNSFSELGRHLMHEIDISSMPNTPLNPDNQNDTDEQARFNNSDIFDPIRKLISYLPLNDCLSNQAKSLMGVLGFEAIQYFESLSLPKNDPTHFPDYTFLYPEQYLVIEKDTIEVVCLDTNQQRADNNLNFMLEKLANAQPYQPQRSLKTAPSSNLSKSKFMNHVTTLKQHINQGDLFQCVLSRRISVPISSSFDAFCRLKKHNPSPYHFYLKLSSGILFGASPETAVNITLQAKKLKVAVTPLAGTRPAGDDSLCDCPKEMAEHMMLVDLARNDLARICKTGTRQVVDLAKAHTYNHISHIRSLIKATLHPELDCFHALKACLPMGTLSGAPKIAAIQTLMNLEGERRGPYGGTIGLFNQNGTMDTAIIIRSCFSQDGQGHVNAGAGIVNDSSPEAEYKETELKASKLVDVLRGELL